MAFSFKSHNGSTIEYVNETCHYGSLSYGDQLSEEKTGIFLDRKGPFTATDIKRGRHVA